MCKESRFLCRGSVYSRLQNRQSFHCLIHMCANLGAWKHWQPLLWKLFSLLRDLGSQWLWRLAIPSKSARSRPGLRADLCVLLESIGCVQLAWELESSAAALPVSSGFNKESHLYSLLQPNPVSNLSQGTLQIYYFFADSKCLDGF